MEAFLPKKNGWKAHSCIKKGAVWTYLASCEKWNQITQTFDFTDCTSIWFLEMWTWLFSASSPSKSRCRAAPVDQKTNTNQKSLIPYKPGSLHGDRFAYKDEYEKFKLYLTVLLLLLSLACYVFLNYRWATPPASTGVCMAITFWCSSSLQIPGCNPQLPAGVVLLHTNHQGEHPHHQRLQVSQSKPRNSSLH